MSIYSDPTSFDFEIERYKSKKTGECIAYLLFANNEYETTTISLKIEGGLDDRGAGIITSAIDQDGEDWSKRLTHVEHDAIIDQIDPP